MHFANTSTNSRKPGRRPQDGRERFPAAGIGGHQVTPLVDAVIAGWARAPFSYTETPTGRRHRKVS